MKVVDEDSFRGGGGGGRGDGRKERECTTTSTALSFYWNIMIQGKIGEAGRALTQGAWVRNTRVCT